jgi:hypothetical protein
MPSRSVLDLVSNRLMMFTTVAVDVLSSWRLGGLELGGTKSSSTVVWLIVLDLFWTRLVKKEVISSAINVKQNQQALTIH